MHARRARTGALALATALLLFVALSSSALAAPLAWSDCDDGFECATAQVPLDYDHPAGKQISLALIRLPAADPGHRIGTLFTNPGGPGNSGVDFVREEARTAYPPGVRARFDLVGFDPRGVGRSTPVRCFADTAEQQAFLGALPPFPVGHAEETAYAVAQAELGRRCLARNGELLSHLSTANVARDLDGLRKAVGDPKLTYVGHSYGTMLGATYASMFPGRVRAVVLDSVLDPVGYTTGRSPFGGAVPMSLRVGSQGASSDALRFFLESCKRAGERCAFSAGDPIVELDRVMARLRLAPITIDLGDGPTAFTYADIVNIVRDVLSFPPAWQSTAAGLAALRDASEPGAGAKASRTGAVALAGLRAAAEEEYSNGDEALAAIVCSETDNPRFPAAWPLAARRADEATPYFGASWAYVSAPCATWPARDHDRYTGPFGGPTANPLLVMNARYDASSSHARAAVVAQSFAGARLLTVEGAGHTLPVQDSSCADGVLERYVVARKLPANGASCAQDSDPFDPEGEPGDGPA